MTDWVRIITEEVDAFDEQVRTYLHYIYDTVVPSLTTRGTPDQRREMYAALDWTALQAPETGDPYLWRKLSADALTLAERQREMDTREMDQAFAQEVTPFGLRPDRAEDFGLNQVMPLGVFGG